jgi:general secretion pathway protein A
MYLNFYQLKKEPFNVTPDPAFLFLSAGHKEALASIVYGVESRKGFLAITGEVGLGKTTILRSYLKDVDPQRLKINYIFNANVSFKGLLKTIYEELGIHPETDDIFEMVNRLQMVLIEEYKKGRNFALIIDDAQNMPFETLENLRMLSNLETSTDKLIQILLIGQPEFEKMLDQNNLRQLKQRITIRATLPPLTQQESMAYIRHRLTKANAVSTTVFTKGALKLIAKKAKGVPRILNILCDNALITGYGYHQRPVTPRIVREVIADFDGKRKSHVLRWGIVTSTVFLILAGLFWLYPYKNLVLTKLGSSVVFQIFQTSQIKEMPFPFVEENSLESTKKTTTIQETINPDNSRTWQISLANGGRKEPSNAEEIQDQKKQTLPVPGIHKEGHNHLKHTEDVYGLTSDKGVN